ncbi:FkbM family methyltransferase [Sphingopyxis sp. USTB-05]|uniref:FkbM family methyltransferase n=1 Tax=Sphingopyxis sp. USTB-05 TaxID=2830667 RepID=UPI0020786D65|nr:FkbM family methyltransferase [Sphingopyxis sp. USTB-05]USI78694.1 FkbM family methyltransferase [Sphingopyxis sp. USTB-05]
MSKVLHSFRSPSQGFAKVSRFVANRQLHTLARAHHTAGYPQMAIFSHDHIGHVINVEGRYEDDYLRAAFGWMSGFLKNMNELVALDIGANIGNHSVFFSRYFLEVHSFEPNPRTFELLKFNASQTDNVTPHRQGLSDADVLGRLRENPTNMGGTFIEIGAAGAPGKDGVSLMTLDTFAADRAFGPIGLIKIDTEGFEARILRGARGVIASNRPVIMFELSPSDFGPNGSDVVNLLSELGYDFVSVERNFQFGESRLGRYSGFLLRTLLGEKLEVRPIERIAPAFYQMIVAVHRGAHPL